METIQTEIVSDVLVIGGAGAGVMSAAEAARAGADVVLAAKGKVGRSGNTIMIGGGFCIDGEGAREICGLADANPAATRRQMYEKLVDSSFYIGNQRLARQYVEKSPYGIRECLQWAQEAGQLFRYMPRGVAWRTSGRAFGQAVRQGLRHAPSVRVYEDVILVDLLRSGSSVCGAIGVDTFTGGLIRFRARSVILATGGFQPFSLQNSCSDMTGDGIAMALRAGASAADMEFMLFIPTIQSPGMAHGSILPYLLTIPAVSPTPPRVTDRDGVELALPAAYGAIPRGNKISKILYMSFWGRPVFEKYARHGNHFYYDYAACSDDEIRRIFARVAQAESDWHPRGKYNKVDLAALAEAIIRAGKRLDVGFGSEYSMGGVVVDDALSTGVPGLYAAGEVTCGTFGAFRSGDGLVEMLAQGLTAGRSAADFAARTTQAVPENTDDILSALTAPLRQTEGVSPVDVLAKIQAIADRGFNFYRTGETLALAADEIEALAARAERMRTADSRRAYNCEWMDAIAARNLLLCTRIGIHAAADRRESRGCHLRLDYPRVDNHAFLHNTQARLEHGSIVYRKVRPVTLDIPLPEQDYSSVPAFILTRFGGKSVENFSVKK